MKNLLMATMLGFTLLGAPVISGLQSGAAYAQDRDSRGHKGGDRRQFRDGRQAQFAPPGKGERGRGQLSEAERQQLRRDLDKANRELYGGRGR